MALTTHLTAAARQAAAGRPARAAVGRAVAAAAAEAAEACRSLSRCFHLRRAKLQQSRGIPCVKSQARVRSRGGRVLRIWESAKEKKQFFFVLLFSFSFVFLFSSGAPDHIPLHSHTYTGQSASRFVRPTGRFAGGGYADNRAVRLLLVGRRQGDNCCGESVHGPIKQICWPRLQHTPFRQIEC